MRTLDDLTPAEVARGAEMLAELRGYGYVAVDRFGRLTPGARVCHRGHRWAEAIIHGTGVIVGITEKPDSPWSRSWGMPDVEIVVAWDEPAFIDSSRLSAVAQYHVYLARTATETYSSEAEEAR